MPVTASPPARRLVLGAWSAFAVLNVVFMWLAPGLETVPFHLIWVSMAIVFGLQAWPLGWAVTACAAVAAATAAPLTAHALAGVIALEEVTEVPLMSLLFLVMVGHVRRRTAAVTEARRSAEREQVATRMQRRLVRLASHELRTPITVARGYTEMLREDSTDARVEQDTAVVLDELGKLERIAGRLMALAWAHETYGARPVNLAALADRAARRWGPVAGPAVRAEVTPTVVLGDEDRLETALDCLVENAIAHTHERPTIVLRAHRDGAWAVLEVEDDGPGLTQSRLTAPRDGNGGLDGVASTHGLGLTIVRGVVDAHGGELIFGPAGPADPAGPAGAGDATRGLRVVIRLPPHGAAR